MASARRLAAYLLCSVALLTKVATSSIVLPTGGYRPTSGCHLICTPSTTKNASAARLYRRNRHRRELSSGVSCLGSTGRTGTYCRCLTRTCPPETNWIVKEHRTERSKPSAPVDYCDLMSSRTARRLPVDRRNFRPSSMSCRSENGLFRRLLRHRFPPPSARCRYLRTTPAVL